MASNETLLPTAHFGVRQAVAVLAHVARPAALYMMRCSRTLRRYAGFWQAQLPEEDADRADYLIFTRAPK